jgi:hypothetical protein
MRHVRVIGDSSRSKSDKPSRSTAFSARHRLTRLCALASALSIFMPAEATVLN